MRAICVRVGLFLAMLTPTMVAWAVPQEAKGPTPEAPKIAPASDEPKKAMKAFHTPAGIEVRLWAAEPEVANPVAFCFDNRGRIFLCETFRQAKGVEDNRHHGHWLDDDLAAQTVEDRLAYIRKHLGAKAEDYTKFDDRIRLLEDTNGDGQADKATVFADHFDAILDGTGAGVLSHGKDVYFTCIPHLWLLRDEDGDGKADVRKSLHSGYGVRFAFRGHDMHGLTLGPDGRLYFTIGDRGLNVKQGDNTLINTESGAVLRCELDGSKLELVQTGMRNPQELAFDDYGNLFTCDNNSDSGDQARWTMIAEGGDSGWRMAYQYLPDRGPFNREKLWHPFHAGQAAYIMPPIANHSSGPSGLAYYPGTGLSEHYQQRFFLCDFRGGPSNSGVRTFRSKPKGAFFELADAEETFWGVLATDVDFGPDGGVYVTDWVNGWNGEGKGRIYKFVDLQQEKNPVVQKVKKMLAEGFAHREPKELAKLLGYADRRIRQETQFALAEKKAEAELADVALNGKETLARLHAIWGLGMVARLHKSETALGPLMKLLQDADAEVRCQAIRVLGDQDHTAAYEGIAKNLSDSNPRVQYFAAMAVGKLGNAAAVPALVAALAGNADADPALRHGLIMGLDGTASEADLAKLAAQESVSVRIGAVVALRKRNSRAVAVFLKDTNPLVVLEAARAIHDQPIVKEYPALAALLEKKPTDDALLRRVLNAHYRLGQPENAEQLAQFAARKDAPPAMRLEALAMLENWAEPSPRDRVLGMWRPLEKRFGEVAAEAFQQHLGGILAGDNAQRSAAAKTAAKLGVKGIGPALHELFTNLENAPSTRAEAITALVALRDPKSDELVPKGLADHSPIVRAASLTALALRKPAAAIPLLEKVVASGDPFEQQAALATLASLKSPEADAIINGALDQLLGDKAPPAIRLDILEAAAGSKASAVKKKLEEYESRRDVNDPLAKYRDSLLGGDATKGRQLFFEKTQLSCVRCHKIGETGGDVGPNLSKIAADKTREYLLEAIATPSKAIAKGFETAIIVNDEGKIFTGILKHEDDKIVRLMTPEGKQFEIPKDTIDERSVGKSAMPEDLLRHLTPREMRDLVELLTGLK